MTPNRPHITILVHRDGELNSRSFRLPVWALRAAAAAGIFLGCILVLGLALYLPIVRTAARVPGLRNQVSNLEEENAKIRQLVAALDSAEARYTQIRQMMGADIVPDPVARGSGLLVAPAIRAHVPGVSVAYEDGASLPRHWPLDDPGYITRGQVGSGTADESHPGIDIAIPVGSLVRAAGGGTVLQAGSDSVYGFFVLLEHPEGYRTMYGHLSRVAVTQGTVIAAGEVIGLSGNSGRSSAPHLHFEIRQEDRSLDPLDMVKEGS
jgi:murein DD-endopeptidase MepM/ murein hydrolase activator NlpD